MIWTDGAVGLVWFSGTGLFSLTRSNGEKGGEEECGGFWVCLGKPSLVTGSSFSSLHVFEGAKDKALPREGVRARTKEVNFLLLGVDPRLSNPDKSCNIGL